MSQEELHKYYKHNRVKLHRSHFAMLPMTFLEWELCPGPPFVRTISRPWLIKPHLVRVLHTEIKKECDQSDDRPVYQTNMKGEKIVDPD